MVCIGNKWDEVLKNEFESEYYIKIREFLKSEYSRFRVFPDMHDIFNSLKYADYDKIKVVIIGQDPYHEIGQAHGLAFSVKPGVIIPPSLRNIYKELNADLGCYIPNNGFLEKWAKQGVLLLNNVLTVREGLANSHKECGWEQFTDDVIRALEENDNPIVYLFWGACAAKKELLVKNPNHYILKSVHPSPLSASRGFFGCKHFSKANDFLVKKGLEPIDWQIENI